MRAAQTTLRRPALLLPRRAESRLPVRLETNKASLSARFGRAARAFL